MLMFETGELGFKAKGLLVIMLTPLPPVTVFGLFDDGFLAGAPSFTP